MLKWCDRAAEQPVIVLERSGYIGKQQQVLHFQWFFLLVSMAPSKLSGYPGQAAHSPPDVCWGLVHAAKRNGKPNIKKEGMWLRFFFPFSSHLQAEVVHQLVVSLVILILAVPYRTKVKISIALPGSAGSGWEQISRSWEVWTSGELITPIPLATVIGILHSPDWEYEKTCLMWGDSLWAQWSPFPPSCHEVTCFNPGAAAQ